MGTNAKLRIIACTELVLSGLLVAGLMSFAGPCQHDDGSVATCFWASRALIGVGAASFVVAAIRLLVSSKALMASGLALAQMVLGVLILAIPDCLISLCMMATMRCHVIMRPFALVCAVLLIISALVDLLMLGSLVRAKGSEAKNS